MKATLRDTFRLFARNPWMLCLPLLAVWYITNTPEEREEFVRRSLDD